MSIQTELTRLTNAKAAIKAAIEGKGVTVPSGTLLDGMAALIDAIEAGGSNNIVAGSFTLLESLTKASPLYIDVTFPKNEFPLMYCVYEDTSNFDDMDTSHTAVRLRYLIGSKVMSNTSYRYFVISSYNNANSFTMKYSGDSVNHAKNDYSTAGGIYGSMDISLSKNQIRFKATSDGEPYLGGRTYNYILYWGD